MRTHCDDASIYTSVPLHVDGLRAAHPRVEWRSVVRMRDGLISSIGC